MPVSEAYNIDCMEYMKNVPDKTYDLAIVDPPYGINAPLMDMGANLKRNGSRYRGESTASRIRKGRLDIDAGKLKDRGLNILSCNWDLCPPSKVYFEELFRVSKNQVIWGGNYFDLPPTRCIICWDKLQPWENFSQFELAWTSFDKPAAIFRYSNAGGVNKEQKIHPTQKPIQLYAWLIRKYARFNDKILDTHLGSGSSRIAAYKLGYDFYATEIDKDFFEAQNTRFKRECFGEIKLKDNRTAKQLSLFD